MNICLLRNLLESKTISQTMSQVKEISDLTDSDEGKQIVRSLNRLNYKQGSSGFGETDNILRIPNPAKRRPIGYDEYPNFERQYIQNINIPTAAKTEGDNDQSLNQDDNYHFLMSLLPYLREVPKNRKMAIRHKLQRVFVDEQERKSGGKNINANHPNLNNFHTPFANMFMTDPMNQPQQIPRLPPPPYPYKQDVFYNYVPSAAGPPASVPMPKAIPSASTLLSNLIVQQQPGYPEYPVSVGLPSGHQQYYNAKANNKASNNNSSFSYNATTVDKNNANKNNNNSSFGYNATAVDNNNSSFSYNATTVDKNNANKNNNNSSFGYNATAVDNNNANNNNSSFSYNAIAVDNNNANNNSSFSSNATAVDSKNANNDNHCFGYNATTVDNNSSSFIYNATGVDNDNATFTNQSAVTGEPQTLTYLQ